MSFAAASMGSIGGNARDSARRLERLRVASQIRLSAGAETRRLSPGFEWEIMNRRQFLVAVASASIAAGLVPSAPAGDCNCAGDYDCCNPVVPSHLTVTFSTPNEPPLYLRAWEDGSPNFVFWARRIGQTPDGWLYEACADPQI